MEFLDNDTLFKALAELNVLDKDVLESVYAESIQSKTSLSDLLLEKDLLSDENLGKLTADIYSVPFIRLSQVKIEEKVREIIPEEVAANTRTIAFFLNEKSIKVATANPRDPDLPAYLAQKTGREVLVYYATTQDIWEALVGYKKNLQTSFDDLLGMQLEKAGKSTEGDKPVTKIFELLVEYAYTSKASDIHIEPQEKLSLVRFRIDGILHDVLNLPKNLHDQLITRIKVLAKLRTDEHLTAQDGKLQQSLEKENLDVRVSIVPIVEGEKAVLRLLSSHSREFSLNDLGMNKEDLEKVREGFAKPFGMVLVTGPTGSGKTTTIYAILKILNTREKNIATIEDPVEYEISGINQIQVNAKTNLTFATGLRSILRQDPNIIFVGEIRDEETADIAVNSAMTGHLVLSTLHTNDSATSLPRLIDLGVEPFLIASTVNTIIAQRLVRKICEKCRFSEVIPLSDIQKLLPSEIVSQTFPVNGDVRLYKGKGCPICHSTGYLGRIALFEVLEVTETIKKLITEEADSATIYKEAQKEGMQTMLRDGIEKVIAGVTTLEEIVRVTKE
jgi:type II secretory ATPase GspE/PulE/Tfp pilus assembly ATPase PilB-like protein